jgi:hypothetical protein
MKNKKRGIIPPDLYVSDQHSNILLEEAPGAFSHITKLTDGETTFLQRKKESKSVQLF